MRPGPEAIVGEAPVTGRMVGGRPLALEHAHVHAGDQQPT
jgi:hypothetical protein